MSEYVLNEPPKMPWSIWIIRPILVITKYSLVKSGARLFPVVCVKDINRWYGDQGYLKPDINRLRLK